MGAGCCGPVYEDRNGILAIRKGIRSKNDVQSMISPNLSLDANYEGIPNRFNTKR